MDVTAIGPLPVGSLVWQRHASVILTVVCKATFMLLPGEAELAEEQEPINPHDAHLEDDPARSVHAPSDLVPFKTRADVVLVGHAFAPRGEPVRSLVVRLIVGDMDKTLEVVGDRAWMHDGALREGPRFTRMALRYERAGGGPDTANPVGLDPEAAPDINGAVRVPNLQPFSFVPSRRGEVIPPIAFGPISASWPGRRESLGGLSPLDDWHGATLPTELDPAYFNCAPRDQQVDRIRDDERIVLENLHPQHARLVMSLPGIRPRAFVRRGSASPQEVAMIADTLWIDTSRGICTLTWRGFVESPPANGRVVVAMEGPSAPLPWSDVQSVARGDEGPHTSRSADARTRRPWAFVPPPSSSSPGSPQGSPQPPTLPAHEPSSDGYPSNGFERAADQTLSGLIHLSELPSISEDGHPVPTLGDASPAWLLPRGAPPSPAVSPTTPSLSAPPTPPAGQAAFFPPVIPAAPVFGAAPLAPDVTQPLARTATLGVSSTGLPTALTATPSSPLAMGTQATANTALPVSPWAAGAPMGNASGATAAPVAAVVSAAPVAVAAPGTAAAASDAAAAQARSFVAASGAHSSPPSHERTSRTSPGEVLDLLWYDEARLPRIRAWWEELVTELDFEPADSKRDFGAEDPEKARGRHNVFGVISDGEMMDVTGLSSAIADAVNEKGRFTPPLVLIGGELRFPFDEVETLKATIVAMTPFVGNDKKLKESLDFLKELLQTPYLQGSTGVVEKLTRELRAELRGEGREPPAGYLDTHVERLLLEQRRYSIRKVFGGELIRAQLASPGTSDPPAPVYLPRQLDQTLPMVIVMKARLIAEAHLQQDPYDASPYALRAIALARSFQLEGPRASSKGLRPHRD